MNKDTQKNLLDKYHHLFAGFGTPFGSWGFETPDGWNELVESLLIELEGYSQNNNTEIKILQIKEKFGILCVWPGPLEEEHRNNVWQILNKYTELSKKTCEITGQPGQLCRRGNWLKTLSIDKARELGYDFIMKVEIDKTKLESLLREIRRAHSEGFRACQFTEAREEDLFNCSSAAKVIDTYEKEFNIKTNTIQQRV